MGLQHLQVQDKFVQWGEMGCGGWQGGIWETGVLSAIPFIPSQVSELCVPCFPARHLRML